MTQCNSRVYMLDIDSLAGLIGMLNGIISYVFPTSYDSMVINSVEVRIQ